MSNQQELLRRQERLEQERLELLERLEQGRLEQERRGRLEQLVQERRERERRERDLPGPTMLSFISGRNPPPPPPPPSPPPKQQLTQQLTQEQRAMLEQLKQYRRRVTGE